MTKAKGVTPDTPKTQRRAYVLPTELVERIEIFQREKGFTSEVEAVRRLLDDALKSRDTLEMIVKRFLDKFRTLKILSEVVKEVLVGHPLIESIHFSDEENIRFTMKDGLDVLISNNGEIYTSPSDGPEGDYHKWIPRSVASPQATKNDDEIIF